MKLMLFYAMSTLLLGQIGLKQRWILVVWLTAVLGVTTLVAGS